MPIAVGTRLGPYEVQASLGAGGMGEVYRARDTRLDRTVAIKILPPLLAADPQFRERFDREAKSISSLNHPNICTLFDVGHEDQLHFLVMEYLEGETLASRLERGALPLAEALAVGTDIASALDKAHRQGIVHRDLKPGNIMLTKSGAKLLDFGLAKTGPAGVLSGSVMTALPTATAPLTAHGTILGTFQYMAPEQIEGEESDARTDIFAFGAVLFEMLTGRRAFSGKTQASLLGAILKDDVPPVSQVQPITPPALDYLVKTCLAKDPDARFQTAHDLLLQLKWIKDGGSAAGLPAPVVAHRKRADRLMWAGIAVASAVVAAAAAWWLKPPPQEPHVVTRFQFALPENQSFTRQGRHTLALSRDGSRLVYVANQQLYVRAFDQLEAQPIRGTNEDPMEPVFSPDGQWVAYFVSTAGGSGPSGGATGFTLKKIAIAGGAPVSLAQVGPPFGATWHGSTIAFAVNGEVAGVQTVPDSGGQPTLIVKDDGTKVAIGHPTLLDDGKHVLFTVFGTNAPTTDEAQIVTQSLDGKGRKVLLTGGTDPHVVADGRLVYVHNGTLLAVPFDARRVEVAGGPVPLVEGVTETGASWSGQYAVSASGTLAFRPGSLTTVAAQRQLVWLDRQGHETPLPVKPRAYQYPRVSPDGTKVALNSSDEENDIWIYDLKKDTLVRLTFGPASEIYSPWMPDGKSVVYSSGDTNNTAIRDLFRKAVDGTGAAVQLTQKKTGGAPSSISPDGKWIVFRTGLSNQPNDLMLMALDGSGTIRPLIADPKYNERNGEISPDGKWIAYDSNDSGRYEVYVRPFPNVDGGRWQISSEGGTYPLWSRSGQELFYIASGANGPLMRVGVQPGSGFNFSKPERLFDTSAYYATTGRTMDIAPDGKHFLTIKGLATDAAVRPSITVVSHWFDEVKTRVTAK